MNFFSPLTGDNRKDNKAMNTPGCHKRRKKCDWEKEKKTKQEKRKEFSEVQN